VKDNLWAISMALGFGAVALLLIGIFLDIGYLSTLAPITIGASLALLGLHGDEGAFRKAVYCVLTAALFPILPLITLGWALSPLELKVCLVFGGQISLGGGLVLAIALLHLGLVEFRSAWSSSG